MIVAGAGVLTVITTADDVVIAAPLSVARAVSVCVPAGAFSQIRLQPSLPFVSSPSFVALSKNSDFRDGAVRIRGACGDRDIRRRRERRAVGRTADADGWRLVDDNGRGDDVDETDLVIAADLVANREAAIAHRHGHRPLQPCVRCTRQAVDRQDSFDRQLGIDVGVAGIAHHRMDVVGAIGHGDFPGQRPHVDQRVVTLVGRKRIVAIASHDRRRPGSSRS